jgi:hypothetical protein
MDNHALLSRRKLLTRSGAVGAAAAVGLVSNAAVIAAQPAEADLDIEAEVTARDVAILKFLAAAELIETDLWQQYAELAEGNPGFADALEQIDDDLGIYTVDITEDELSHAEFINAFLETIGEEPVSLSQFATLPPPRVTGLEQVARLTNLTHLTIDTSYYTRYRSVENPDFGFQPPQIATIKGRPAIPTSDSLSDEQLSGVAQTAAFHFPSIEQGGTSLYDQFVPFVKNKNVLRIVSSIYATEAIHYAIFRDSLTGVTGFDSGDGTLVIPDLTEGQNESNRVMPRPCDFLSLDLPRCSVIRPSSLDKAGAQAAADALTRSGLFIGQSPAFFRALNALAAAADGVKRRRKRPHMQPS